MYEMEVDTSVLELRAEDSDTLGVDELDTSIEGEIDSNNVALVVDGVDVYIPFICDLQLLQVLSKIIIFIVTSIICMCSFDLNCYYFLYFISSYCRFIVLIYFIFL